MITIIKNYLHIYYILLLSISLSSCNADDYSSDQKIQEHMEQLRETNKKVTAKVNDINRDINSKEIIKNSMGLNNKNLQEELKSKEKEISLILKELYDDTGKGNEIYTATCNRCNKKVTITYAKFYEMVKRYNTGWAEHYSYKWFLWCKWSYKTESFEFNRCPSCKTESYMKELESWIASSTKQLAEIEADIIKKRLKLEESKKQINLNDNSSKHIKNLANDRENLKEKTIQETKEKLAAIQEAEREKLQKEQIQKEKEEIQKKMKEQAISTAQLLISLGVSGEIIAEKTGLSKEEINKILTYN